MRLGLRNTYSKTAPVYKRDFPRLLRSLHFPLGTYTHLSEKEKLTFWDSPPQKKMTLRIYWVLSALGLAVQGIQLAHQGTEETKEANEPPTDEFKNEAVEPPTEECEETHAPPTLYLLW